VTYITPLMGLDIKMLHTKQYLNTIIKRKDVPSTWKGKTWTTTPSYSCRL